jgi:hypothetical protein
MVELESQGSLISAGAAKRRDGVVHDSGKFRNRQVREHYARDAADLIRRNSVAAKGHAFGWIGRTVRIVDYPWDLTEIALGHSGRRQRIQAANAPPRRLKLIE